MIRRLLVTDAPTTTGTETDTPNAPVSPTITQQRGITGGTSNISDAGMARHVPGSSSSSNTSGHQSPSARSPRRFE